MQNVNVVANGKHNSRLNPGKQEASPTATPCHLMVLSQLNVLDRLILESFRKKIKLTYPLRHASSSVQMCYLVLM